MMETCLDMGRDGSVPEDIKLLYANKDYLLAHRAVIECNPEMAECRIGGLGVAMMYVGGPDVDFLHVLEEWGNPDSPLVLENGAGHACYTYFAGGSPLSGTNKCHAYCPAEDARYVLRYKSLQTPVCAMLRKGGVPRRPEPYRPPMSRPGAFAEFSRQDVRNMPPVECSHVYNATLSLAETLLLLRAEGALPGVLGCVATVARLQNECLYLQLQVEAGHPLLWIYDAADMSQARSTYCVQLPDLQLVPAPPPGVAAAIGLEVHSPTEQGLERLHRVLSGYSQHWGGISVLDFAMKQAASLAMMVGVKLRSACLQGGDECLIGEFHTALPRH